MVAKIKHVLKLIVHNVAHRITGIKVYISWRFIAFIQQRKYWSFIIWLVHCSRTQKVQQTKNATHFFKTIQANQWCCQLIRIAVCWFYKTIFRQNEGIMVRNFFSLQKRLFDVKIGLENKQLICVHQMFACGCVYYFAHLKATFLPSRFHISIQRFDFFHLVYCCHLLSSFFILVVFCFALSTSLPLSLSWAETDYTITIHFFLVLIIEQSLLCAFRSLEWRITYIRPMLSHIKNTSIYSYT